MQIRGDENREIRERNADAKGKPNNSEPPPNPRLGKAGESGVPSRKSKFIWKWEIPPNPSLCKEGSARSAGGVFEVVDD